AGPRLAKAAGPTGPDDTSEELEGDLARLGAGLLVSATDAIRSGDARETPQDESKATYAHRLTREDGRIAWDRPAAQIHNLIRGLHPWPHAFAFIKGQRVI